MPTANERIADDAVRHAINLERYSTGVVQRMIALLNRADADIFAALTSALLTLPADSFSVERLESLLSSVRQLNATAYNRIAAELGQELRELVAYEAGYQLQLFEATIPPQVVASVGVAAVSVEQVYTAAMARPFQGRLLREWAAGMEQTRMLRIRDAVRQGYVQQETTEQIIRRIRGTRAKGYSDGIIEIDRRSAEAVVRTAVSHTAAVTRDRFFEDNNDLVKAQVWTATLDTRTSDVCKLRDGKQYMPVSPYKPIGHGYPWLGGPGRAHWRCRSSAVPVLKSWRELGGADIEEFSPSTRASMDGQVPAEQTYGAWLKRQSAARQDDILGATRGALLRRGGLNIERFADSKGRWLSIEELRKRDAQAFDAAGV